MICAMKVISVGFDIDSYERKKFSQKRLEEEEEEEGERTLANGRQKSGRRNRKPEPEGQAKSKVAEQKYDDYDDEDVGELPGWFEYAGSITIVNREVWEVFLSF